MKRLFYSILTLSTLLWGNAYAQQWEVGVHGGATGFMGDVNPDNPFYLKNAGGGFFVKRNLNSTWGVQLGYSYLRLHANDKDDSDPYRNARGHFFYNNVHELAARADFNFFRFIPGQSINRYTPYLFAGLAVIKHNPYVNFKDAKKINLDDLQLQVDDAGDPIKTKKIAIALPIGAGFKYNISGPWSVGAEIGYRTAFNNNLDNISGNYPLSAEVPKGLPADFHPSTEQPVNLLWQNIAFPNGDFDTYKGKAKGHGRKRDGYMTAGFTLTYTFIDKRCYWWK